MAENYISKHAKPCFWYFITGFLFWGLQNGYAQLKLDYGPKVGGNISFFRGDMPFNGMAKPKFGFSVGGFLNIRSTKKKKFQFEANALFTLRGNNSEYLNSDLAAASQNILGQEEKSYTIGYLEFPLLFKYAFDLSSFMRPYVMAGPTYSGIWFANYKSGSYEEDVRNDIWRDDFGITIGGGISWFFLSRWYFVDIRYFHGVFNISERLTKNLDPFNPDISKDPIRGKIDVFIKDGAFYNSTIAITFGVSLSRQAILKY